MSTNNVGNLIKDFVERLVNLKKEEASCKLRRKVSVEALKAADLPAAELIALKKRDMEKTKEKAEKVADAGALLGLSTFTTETEPVSAADRGYADDVKAVLDEHLDLIEKEDEEIAGIREDMKDILKEVKANTLSKNLILQCVEFVLNPEAVSDYKDDQSALFDIYWSAAEPKKVEAE